MPADDKSVARRAVSFEQLAGELLAAHVALKRKSRTLESYRYLLAKMAGPALGRLKAKDVKRADVARLHMQHAAATRPLKGPAIPKSGCLRDLLGSDLQ